ncbi:hypothetical protein HK096_001042 [Nowakowskiella sp. JEL0078]|nr:hypothetical protein HK096_001042 [Nowakowskiella sp. JEL0078]
MHFALQDPHISASDSDDQFVSLDVGLDGPGFRPSFVEEDLPTNSVPNGNSANSENNNELTVLKERFMERQKTKQIVPTDLKHPLPPPPQKQQHIKRELKLSAAANKKNLPINFKGDVRKVEASQMLLVADDKKPQEISPQTIPNVHLDRIKNLSESFHLEKDNSTTKQKTKKIDVELTEKNANLGNRKSSNLDSTKMASVEGKAGSEYLIIEIELLSKQKDDLDVQFSNNTGLFCDHQLKLKEEQHECNEIQTAIAAKESELTVLKKKLKEAEKRSHFSMAKVEIMAENVKELKINSEKIRDEIKEKKHILAGNKDFDSVTHIISNLKAPLMADNHDSKTTRSKIGRKC